MSTPDQHFLYVDGRVQPCDSDLKERFLSLIVCLFMYLFFAIRISRFFLILFFFMRIFYPHFPIRIRHPQVSGPRFTDTPNKSLSI